MKQFLVKTNATPEASNIILWRDVRVTVLSDRLFRVEQSADPAAFTDKATQVVWFRNFGAVSFKTCEKDGALWVSTPEATLVWCGSEASSYVLLKGSDEKRPLDNDDNLKGTYRTLDRCDGDMCLLPAPWCKEQVYPVFLRPGVMSKNGVAVLDDSVSLLMGDDGMIVPRAHEEEDLYVFAFGHDYRAALRAYFDICGPAPLIPRFALGNWWSRYYKYTEKSYLHLMDDLKEQRLPFTVATIDMNWHWSVNLDKDKRITELGKNDEWHGGNDGWTGYSWDTNYFPDHQHFFDELKKRNLRITLNVHPSDGVRWFEDCYEEFAKAMGIDPKTEQWIKFDLTDPKFLKAYFEIIHHRMEDEGVDFWWIDWQQGSVSRIPGLDPLWMLNHYHYLDNNERHADDMGAGLILSRFAGNGSHRYPLGFSGDTYVTWASLKFIPYFTATASNIGFTWWSHDIGGHMRGIKDDELYVRYNQFGVFSPINRLHSNDYILFTKEPWAYMNGAGTIVCDFLRLRHRMIPFLFSASVNTTRDGLALMEPLYYEWPEAPEAYNYGNTYMYGQQLLCAPITEHSVTEGMASVTTWLPEGVWTDIFSGEEYYIPAGGRVVKMVRYLDTFPALLRQGGFFVLDNRDLTNDSGLPDALEVMCTNGNGSYVLHEEVRPGVFADTKFESTEGAPQAEGTKCDEGPKYDGGPKCDGGPSLQHITVTVGAEAPARNLLFRFLNISEGEVLVTANGERISAEVDDNHRLTARFDVRPGITYEITITHPNCAFQHRLEQLAKTLTRLQMPNRDKQQWERGIMKTECDPIPLLSTYPDGSALPEIVIDRLKEITENY